MRRGCGGGGPLAPTWAVLNLSRFSSARLTSNAGRIDLGPLLG
jgi:hypothetical protein